MTISLRSGDFIEVLERVGDPAAVADSGLLYTKDDTAITELFYRASDGTVTQLTGVGGTGGWTDDGTVVRLTTATDQVSIGVDVPPASPKLHLLADRTIASAAGAVWDGFNVAASTATITGAVGITTATGFNLISINAPTLSAALALTVTNAATLYVGGAPVGAGAGPATITNAFSLWVDAGTSRFDGVILGSDGSAAVPSISFTSDPNTGLFSQAADAIGVSTGGTERLRLITSQLLGSDGTAALPFWSFISDPNTGFFSQAADVIGISTAGVEQYRVDAVGNLTMRNDDDFTPATDNTGDLGTDALRWKRIRGVDIVSGDLHLINDDGSANWTIREGVGKIEAVDNVTGKRYELALKEVA
jgi:hypothetical protein